MLNPASGARITFDGWVTFILEFNMETDSLNEASQNLMALIYKDTLYTSLIKAIKFNKVKHDTYMVFVNIMHALLSEYHIPEGELPDMVSDFMVVANFDGGNELFKVDLEVVSSLVKDIDSIYPTQGMAMSAGLLPGGSKLLQRKIEPKYGRVDVSPKLQKTDVGTGGGLGAYLAGYSQIPNTLIQAIKILNISPPQFLIISVLFAQERSKDFSIIMTLKDLAKKTQLARMTLVDNKLITFTAGRWNSTSTFNIRPLLSTLGELLKSNQIGNMFFTQNNTLPVELNDIPVAIPTPTPKYKVGMVKNTFFAQIPANAEDEFIN